MNSPQYVDVNGARTRYISTGEGDPIVLVHGGHFGGSGTAEDWEPIIDRLAQTHHVVAYDKLGMGFTDNPVRDDDYVIESHTSHLLGLLDALGLNRAHLVGHSRGGYPVTRVALDHSHRVQTLTVVSSSSVTHPFNPIYQEWRRRAEAMDEREAVTYLISANSYSDSHITEQMVDVGVEVGRLEKTRLARERMSAGLYDRFKTDLLERVERIKTDMANGGLAVPTLVMWGFDDPSATMDRCGKPAIDQFFPSVERCEMHILGGAGHYCFREQPEAFCGTLLGFIDRNVPVADPR